MNKKIQTVLKLALMGAFICLSNTLNARQVTENKHHQHKEIEVPTSAARPQFEIKIHKDETSGFNLHMVLNHYLIEPPEHGVLPDNCAVRGHAHLFINGNKIGRLYGIHHHIPNKLIQTGINVIAVTLNTHQHDTWSLDQRPITASITLDTRKEHLVVHAFSSSPINTTSPQNYAACNKK